MYKVIFDVKAIEFLEKLDQVLKFLVEQLVNTGQLNKAEALINEIQELSIEDFSEIEQIHQKYPAELNKAIQKTIEKQQIFNNS